MQEIVRFALFVIIAFKHLMGFKNKVSRTGSEKMRAFPLKHKNKKLFSPPGMNKRKKENSENHLIYNFDWTKATHRYINRNTEYNIHMRKQNEIPRDRMTKTRPIKRYGHGQ